KDKWQTADQLWMNHYHEQNASLVDGAGETIAVLHDKGFRLGIVSSGSHGRVGGELELLGLRPLFEVVICNEQTVNKKPHAEALQTALALLDCCPGQSCYVGDSPEDIEMGRSANVLTIGVRSSYPTNWKLRDSKPDIYLESLRELSSLFV